MELFLGSVEQIYQKRNYIMIIVSENLVYDIPQELFEAAIGEITEEETVAPAINEFNEKYNEYSASCLTELELETRLYMALYHSDLEMSKIHYKMVNDAWDYIKEHRLDEVTKVDTPVNELYIKYHAKNDGSDTQIVLNLDTNTRVECMNCFSLAVAYLNNIDCAKRIMANPMEATQKDVYAVLNDPHGINIGPITLSNKDGANVLLSLEQLLEFNGNATAEKDEHPHKQTHRSSPTIN